jgi:3-deoxy-D-manno-octulosonic-acid transferase
LNVSRRAAAEPIRPDTDIYLADTLGELGTLMTLTGLVFMGKSLIADGGGHNPVEPIRLDAAVLTGPSIHNFLDAFQPLIAAGAVKEVRTAEALADALPALLLDPGARAALAALGRAELAKIAGALPQTLAALLTLLPPPATGGSRRALADAVVVD